MIAKDLSVGFSIMSAIGLSVALFVGLSMAGDKDKIDVSKLEALGTRLENRQNKQAEEVNALTEEGKFTGDKLNEVIALNNSAAHKISAGYYEYLLCVGKKDKDYCERAETDLNQGKSDMDKVDRMILESQEIEL